MTEARHQLEEQRISIKDLYDRIRFLLAYLWTNKLKIILLSIVIGGLFFSYHKLKSIEYTARDAKEDKLPRLDPELSTTKVVSAVYSIDFNL
jgi:hypothetical protein